MSGLICSSLSTSSAPRTSLGAIAQALHQLFPSPSLLIRLVSALLPEGSLPPSAGDFPMASHAASISPSHNSLFLCNFCRQVSPGQASRLAMQLARAEKHPDQRGRGKALRPGEGRRGEGGGAAGPLGGCLHALGYYSRTETASRD